MKHSTKVGVICIFIVLGFFSFVVLALKALEINEETNENMSLTIVRFDKAIVTPDFSVLLVVNNHFMRGFVNEKTKVCFDIEPNEKQWVHMSLYHNKISEIHLHKKVNLLSIEIGGEIE